MFGKFAFCRAHQQLSGHAQMNNPLRTRAAHGCFRFSQIENDVLAGAADIENFLCVESLLNIGG